MKTVCVLISLVGYAPVDDDLHLRIDGRDAQLMYKGNDLVAVEKKSHCLLRKVKGVDWIGYDTDIPLIGVVTVKPEAKDDGL